MNENTPYVRVGAERLREFAAGILRQIGVDAPRAELVADSLVAANLRGVDSHGVHILPYYVRQIRAKNVDPGTDGAVVSESGACLLYDGRRGLGQCVSAACCNHAMRLARQYGIGIVVARNSSHFGAAAYWGQRISAGGFIGIVMCNASPSVPPWQGRDGRIGTNPVCVSVPAGGGGAWLLDMATTTVAKNRIVKAAASGEKTIPAGWAMDPEGVPTTDTAAAMRGLLMPLGGYKGSGLGVMVEVLCAVLSGGTMASEVGGLYITERPMSTSQTFLAIDVGRFLPLEAFDARMNELTRLLRDTRPASGYDEVMVAGDPEWRSEARRLRDGIPVEPAVWKALAALAAEFGVTMLPE